MGAGNVDLRGSRDGRRLARLGSGGDRLIYPLFFFASILGASAVEAPPRPFDEAVRVMLARDTEIGAAAAEAEGAGAVALGARYHFLPTLTVDGTETWAKETPKTISLLGTASLPLFRFGADMLAAESANLRVRSARARVDRVRLERETKAVVALLEFIRAAEAREILATLEEKGKASVTIAERQYVGGRIAAQEVEKVRIDLENTRFRRAEAEQAWVDARAIVEARLGDASVAPGFPWKERIGELPAAPLDPSAALRLRPEWLELEAEARAAEAAARSAFRELLPNLSTRASYGWTRDQWGAPNDRLGWLAALTLSFPIFSSFRDYARYRVQTEAVNAVEARLEGVKRDVLAETRSVPSRYEIARRSALAREAVLQTSKRLYEDNLSRFRQGRATTYELNVDLNRYLETQLGALSGWVAAHRAYVDLVHLRGTCVVDCGRL